MLSASITLHRRRKDGVGIKSADVVFALSGKNTPPADGDVWKSLVSDLILVPGQYLWSCTKVTKTDGETAYTGKYCLGYALDFADAVEMYYLSTNGTTVPDPNKVSFSLTYTAKKGYYLWTCVRYTVAGVYVYSTPRCDSYFPNDGTNGTSFTPKGEANAHFSLSSEITDKTAGKVYLVDKNDTSMPVISAPCVVRFTQGSGGSVLWNSTKAETGDAYMIGSALWVNNGSEWVQFGQIQGPAGEDGNALTLYISPMKFTYTIGEDGSISNKEHTFYYMAFWGDAVLQESNSDVHFAIQCPDGCHFKNTNDNYYAGLSGAGTGTIKDSGVESTTYNLAGKDISAYYTSAYIMLVVTYKGFVAQARIDLEGDMSLFNSDTIETKKEFTRKYESLESTLTEHATTISMQQTEIYQNANDIKLRATKTEVDDADEVLSKQIGEVEVKADKVSAKVDDLTDSLEATGVDITNKKVLVTADNFEVRNNSGKKTMSVDADGNLVTEGTTKVKGGIEAQYGYIGSFTLQSYTDATGVVFYGLSSSTQGSASLAPNSVVFSNDGIEVRSQYSSALGGIVTIGHGSDKVNNEFNWGNGLINVSGQFSGSGLAAEQSAYNAFVYGNSKNIVSCYKADAQGGAANNAFFAKNGDVKIDNGRLLGGGFCPSIKNVSSSMTLKTTDCIVICDNTSEITLTLPSSPTNGQTYLIRNTNANVKVQRGGSYKMYGDSVASDNLSFTSNRKNQMTMVVFDGSKWLVNWYNG